MQGHPGTETAELATVAEAAERLRVSQSTLLRMIHDGRLAEHGIRAVRPGRDWKVIKADLDAYLASGQASQTPEASPIVPVLIRIDARAEGYLRAGAAELDAADPLVDFAERLLGRVADKAPSEARGFIADEVADAELSAHQRDARTRLPRRHPMRSGLNAVASQYL